ncbi:unnamed protein product [Staurois parvus]|uniref:Uncharacterized protein n=1 Tax=Staurois parvus TaxID=386267 RepID=A0ABN9CC21_9NEOB|nr:unnamed protein product [Staurois parvus]
MTRDCGHSTGDDQRLQTVKEITRDCGPLGREGERVLNLTGTRSHFHGVVLPSSSRGGFCDSRVPNAQREKRRAL